MACCLWPAVVSSLTERVCCEGDGSWQCWQDSEVAANICKHLDTLPACTVEQFNSLLQKRDYHPEEKEERQGDCSKRQRQQSEAGAAVETQA